MNLKIPHIEKISWNVILFTLMNNYFKILDRFLDNLENPKQNHKNNCLFQQISMNLSRI